VRIAQLSATFPPYRGGAGTACFNLSVELAKRGHEVHVVTGEAEGDPPDTGAVRVHRERPWVRIGNAPLIPRIAQVRDFDVVHLHYPFIFGAELLLAGRLRARSAPLVVSYHNRLIGNGARRPLFWLYEETVGRALVSRCDRVLTVSEAHAETVSHLRRLRRRATSRLAVLPDGVDLEAFTPGEDRVGFRAAHGVPSSAVLGIFVGTLDRAHFFKRLDLAIEAIAALGGDGPHLLVAGGGEWLQRYRDHAHAVGARERVHFAGPLGHEVLPDLVRAGDFLLLTSDLESFGIVLLEAMACAVPPIATDLPGTRAVISQESLGMLVPRGDARAIAAGIRRMIGLGAEGRRRMGIAGRAECERRYAWPTLASRLEAIYLDVLDGSSR
jgi:glycosyltransferase involved in cell wall biosynthesis